MKQCFLLVIWFVCASRLASQPATKTPDIEMLHRSQQVLTDVIVHDIFSPPVASRIYAYCNIAAYEATNIATAAGRPLTRISAAMPDLSSIKNPVDVSPGLSAVYAFLSTAKSLVFSEKRLQDSVDLILSSYRSALGNDLVYNNSIRFGKLIADSVLSWGSKDSYKQTRSMRRYSFKKDEGKWLPTPPAYIAAVEPNWGKMRCLFLDSASQFKPAPPAVYGFDTSGSFYKQVMEVYNTGKSLTAEQRDIALFWDCNPFFVNMSGHLVYATKKLSPGGHWISITGIASRLKGKSFWQTVEAYTMVSVVLYDGFISCWDEKYRSNYIRPETVINARVDEAWRPLLQTPPFPEYTSGHSVISNAAAVVLTYLFGEDVSFHDNTETAFGLPVRTFTSFHHAAKEAAISRLYGGIHFMDAIRNGELQGRRLGEFMVSKMKMAGPGKLE